MEGSNHPSNDHDIVQSIFESHAEIRPNGDSFLRGRSLLNLLKLSGIQRNDIRLAASFEALEQLGSSGAELSLSDFRNVIASSEVRRILIFRHICFVTEPSYKSPDPTTRHTRLRIL